MVDHVRRFNPSHQWINHKIKAGEIVIQQMDIQTYFLRRSNLNALGELGPGPIICFGTMPVIQLTYFSTRPVNRRGKPLV